MKKQNPNNKLTFNKAAVTELNTNQLQNVNGGTSSTTVGTTSLIMVTVLTLAAE
jgi:bacteriocin-like protein